MPIHRVAGGWKWGKHGKIYKNRRGAELQARAAYANGYRGDAKRLPMYRADSEHKVGIEVPPGGSHCTNCEYFTGPDQCGNAKFQAWNGGPDIPAPDGDANRYCCDYWATVEPL